MPPDSRLDDETIQLLERWVQQGAPGPAEDMGDTEFSQLGDQEHLFGKAENHWAFQPVAAVLPPAANAPRSFAAWNRNPIDRLVYGSLDSAKMTPSRRADAQTLARRLHYDLTGLPPSYKQLERFATDAQSDIDRASAELIDRLIQSPEYGQHIARMWLDVVRYADTDSAYRPDTKTPHYFPFAFTYRDYVVAAFNADKPFDQFVKEQIAADLMELGDGTIETVALGFFAIGPHGKSSPKEAIDDWIDLTTRGLMGLTVACARCHDHKFEPIPTADYYSLRGVFNALTRINALDEQRQPEVSGYQPTETELADYRAKRSTIDAKIVAAAGKKARGNNRPISTKIRETELAELLLFHPGAPARAMLVKEIRKPPKSFVFVRGDATSRGDAVPRRFLKILDPPQPSFPEASSGRLQLAEKIASADNPLTARVMVNRVWGHLVGSHLVSTASDFGLQGSPPSHPELLDWMAEDFVRHGWSVKHLVRQIVSTQTYQQSGRHREVAASMDPENKLFWRANRKHMTIEAIRDRILAVSGQLDRRVRGRSERLWGDGYTRRRAIYGFINRFNLDPTLRAFDFPTPMQTQPGRGESIVAPQVLFLMNSPMVADQVDMLTQSHVFLDCPTDPHRIAFLFETILARKPAANELARCIRMVEYQARFKKPPQGRASRFVLSPWPLIAQALMMGNEFQYVD